MTQASPPPMPQSPAITPSKPLSKKEIANEALGRLSLGERLLLFLAKHPSEVERVSDYEAPTTEWTLETALEVYESGYPAFRDRLAGQRILDYGCGDGFQAVAMAMAGAKEVVGVDLSPRRLEFARALAKEAGVTNVSFTDVPEGKFDMVTTLNAVEHFPRPEENLLQMSDALVPGGKIYATFGPPWAAPFGSHMYFFVKFPWVNLIFSEKTVYRIRSLYRSDGFTKYSPDLNRMTVKRFEKILPACGLKAESSHYRTVKNLPVVGKVPALRELFVTHIDAVIVHASPRTS